MSINLKKFVPRPGLVNKQGRLPDPAELVCVEIPKVFDQCLIKRCLVYCDGPDTNKTDYELRSNPLDNAKRFICGRDYKITLTSVEKFSLAKHPSFKKLIISYIISFYADYVDCKGVTQSEFYEINRTDVIAKFYCPDSLSHYSNNLRNESQCDDSHIIKLEMVAQALDGDLLTDEKGNCVLDITLGYYIVVKCELIVQLLIPAYDYCPVPKEICKLEPEEDPCEIFEHSPIPKFYPDQNLSPLFNDHDDPYDDLCEDK